MSLIKPSIIHLVDDKGRPLCGFTWRSKRAWSKGHYWCHPEASKHYRKMVNCKKCKAKV